MSPIANKQLVEGLVENVFNRGDYDAFPQYFRAGTFWAGTIQEALGMYRMVGPDIVWTVEDLLAEENKVMAKLGVKFTFTEEGMKSAITGEPIHPTGKQVQMTTIWIFRFKDDKIVSGDIIYDRMELFQQMGVIAQMAAALASTEE